MDDSNSRLRAKLKASEAKEAHVRSELADLKGHLRRQTQESELLRTEVAKLKRMLTVQFLCHTSLSMRVLCVAGKGTAAAFLALQRCINVLAFSQRSCSAAEGGVPP